MSAETLRDFFFWSMIINGAVYAVSVLTTLRLRNFLTKTYQRMFAMNEQEMLISVQHYLAIFKLLIIVLNFAPWLALHLIA